MTYQQVADPHIYSQQFDNPLKKWQVKQQGYYGQASMSE